MFYVRASCLPLRGDKGKVIGLSGVLADVSERKQAEEKLRIYHERVAALAVELSRIEELERRRIANDLHDHIGQILALSKIKLGCLRQENQAPGFLGKIDEIRDLIDQSIQYTRTLTFELSPPILYELGLGAALEWLAESVGNQNGLTVAVEVVEGSLNSLNDEKRIMLFKVVRELLHNVVKHARAKRSRVRTWTGDGRIWITVEDDGLGFDPSKSDILPTRTQGFGLFSIRESLKLGGGHLNVLSEPGRGTKATLSLPLTNGSAAGDL
jgi:signal transduction histidine kinase